MNNILIFGVGLIGGSLALALKKTNSQSIVAGAGRSQASLEMALSLGIIDHIAVDISAGVQAADVIVIAAPVAQTPVILSLIKPHLKKHAVVTDVGSTKGDVAQYAYAILADQAAQFVPAHPIAGAEKTGPEAAKADLFSGKHVILTPNSVTNNEAIATITALWQSTGAVVSCMSTAEHDAIFASVSHLPHLLAFALVDELASRSNADVLFKFAASGFRDFTRIAASSPEMWCDISLANKNALIDEMTAYEMELKRLKTALISSDTDTLLALFQRASTARKAWHKSQ